MICCLRHWWVPLLHKQMLFIVSSVQPDSVRRVVFIQVVFSHGEREREVHSWDMTLSRTAVWILIALCGKALSALTHRDITGPHCAAGGRAAKTEVTASANGAEWKPKAQQQTEHHHVSLTQNHWRQRGRFPSTQWCISYVNTGYTFDTLPKLDEGDSWSVTWRIFSLLLFSAKEAIWHIQWSTITNPFSHGLVLRSWQ